MFQKISTILIWSEDFRKLANWYQETFNLKFVTFSDPDGNTLQLIGPK